MKLTGVLLAIVGAYHIHIGLGLIVTGAALAALGEILRRRPPRNTKWIW